MKITDKKFQRKATVSTPHAKVDAVTLRRAVRGMVAPALDHFASAPPVTREPPPDGYPLAEEPAEGTGEPGRVGQPLVGADPLNSYEAGERAGMGVAMAVLNQWAEAPTSREEALAVAEKYADLPDGNPGTNWWKGFRSSLEGQRLLRFSQVNPMEPVQEAPVPGSPPAPQAAPKKTPVRTQETWGADGKFSREVEADGVDDLLRVHQELNSSGLTRTEAPQGAQPQVQQQVPQRQADSWWEGATYQQQKDYIQKHPKTQKKPTRGKDPREKGEPQEKKPEEGKPSWKGFGGSSLKSLAESVGMPENWAEGTADQHMDLLRSVMDEERFDRWDANRLMKDLSSELRVWEGGSEEDLQDLNARAEWAYAAKDLLFSDPQEQNGVLDSYKKFLEERSPRQKSPPGERPRQEDQPRKDKERPKKTKEDKERLKLEKDRKTKEKKLERLDKSLKSLNKSMNKTPYTDELSAEERENLVRAIPEKLSEEDHQDLVDDYREWAHLKHQGKEWLSILSDAMERREQQPKASASMRQLAQSPIQVGWRELTCPQCGLVNLTMDEASAMRQLMNTGSPVPCPECGSPSNPGTRQMTDEEAQTWIEEGRSAQFQEEEWGEGGEECPLCSAAQPEWSPGSGTCNACGYDSAAMEGMEDVGGDPLFEEFAAAEDWEYDPKKKQPEGAPGKEQSIDLAVGVPNAPGSTPGAGSPAGVGARKKFSFSQVLERYAAWLEKTAYNKCSIRVNGKGFRFDLDSELSEWDATLQYFGIDPNATGTIEMVMHEGPTDIVDKPVTVGSMQEAEEVLRGWAQFADPPYRESRKAQEEDYDDESDFGSLFRCESCGAQGASYRTPNDARVCSDCYDKLRGEAFEKSPWQVEAEMAEDDLERADWGEGEIPLASPVAPDARQPEDELFGESEWGGTEEKTDLHSNPDGKSARTAQDLCPKCRAPLSAGFACEFCDWEMEPPGIENLYGDEEKEGQAEPTAEDVECSDCGEADWQRLGVCQSCGGTICMEGCPAVGPHSEYCEGKIRPLHEWMLGKGAAWTDSIKDEKFKLKMEEKSKGKAKPSEEKEARKTAQPAGFPPAAAGMDFEMSNEHSAGDRVVFDVSWSPEDVENLSEESVRQLIRNFVQTDISNRKSTDQEGTKNYGTIADPTIEDFDPDAGLATVSFMSSEVASPQDSAAEVD